LTDRYYPEINTVNPLGQKGQLAKEFGKLLKKMWNDGLAYLPPTDFKVAHKMTTERGRALVVSALTNCL
jgi:ubiquitin C-terminal hydrolase